MDFGPGQSYTTTLLVASAVLVAAVLWFVWRSRNRRSEDEIKRMMAADA
jgi:HAMP domain-containing protein